MLFNKRIAVYVVLLSVLFATSCKKYLTLYPQDGIIRDEFWKTKEQVQASVIGCYASLLGAPAGVSDRPMVDYLFMWGELRADMLAPGAGISRDELDIMNVNTLSNNTITNWRSLYRTINYCNTVIDFAPGVLTNDKTFSEQALNQYLAEAKGLRALMYFYLVRSFGDVPLKLKSTSSDEEIVQIPKTSKDSVLLQIVDDLKFAELYAPATYGERKQDKGRITKAAVNALQADVFLWLEKYPEAITACDKVINTNNFGLIQGNSAWFTTLYYTGNSNESIFEFQFDEQKLNPFYNMFAIGAKRFMAAPAVMDEVYGVDYTNPDAKDIRGDGAAVRISDNSVWKFISFDYNSIRSANESFTHWFVYRYADILLMKAEALALTEKGQEALDLVKTIRQRAKAIALTDRPNIDPTSTEEICDFILEERAREFAFEGKRWYDILRHAKRNNYSRLDIIQDMVVKSVAPALQQTAVNKYKDVNSHYFPIYIYELQTNKNLVQNPYYK